MYETIILNLTVHFLQEFSSRNIFSWENFDITSQNNKLSRLCACDCHLWSNLLNHNHLRPTPIFIRLNFGLDWNVNVKLNCLNEKIFFLGRGDQLFRFYVFMSTFKYSYCIWKHTNDFVLCLNLYMYYQHVWCNLKGLLINLLFKCFINSMSPTKVYGL